jgi:hypothetical protein
MRQLQKVAVQAARRFRSIVEEHDPEPDLFRWRLYDRSVVRERAGMTYRAISIRYRAQLRSLSIVILFKPLGEGSIGRLYLIAREAQDRALDIRHQIIHATTGRAAETNPNFGLLVRLERKLGDDSLGNTTLSSAAQH